VTGPEQSERRRGLVYGRRKGPRLSSHQARLFDALLPQLKLDLRQGADPAAYFRGTPVDVWLEIGFGAGEHLLWQAQLRPDVGMIGAEPYEAGIAKLLSKLFSLSPEGGRNQPSNIRIHIGDARDVIEALPARCLGRVFVLFPDPWPKKRHHKRRIIQTNTLDALARVMSPGAELRFASDDPGYIEWTLERVLAHPEFTWTAMCARDWRARPADWPPTRYERKALHGVPLFLRFRRL